MNTPRKGIDYIGITTIFICHDGDGHVFMAKRSQKARDERGRWDVGAGGLDFGLAAEENVRKEVEEEYGTSPERVDFLGYTDIFRTHPDGMPTHWLGLVFLVKIGRNEAKINERDKFDDCGWFSLDNLPSPLHSQNLSTFKKYATSLKEFGLSFADKP